MTDIFAQIRGRLTAAEVATRYGFQPNRAGFICCPVHGEETPSLRLYDAERGFYCFGCHNGGSVIDFTAKLFGIQPIEAAKKLNDDFSLGLAFTEVSSGEERRHRDELDRAWRAFEAWREQTRNGLNACLRVANRLAVEAPVVLSNGHCVALREREQLELWADTLTSGAAEEQAEVFRRRKEIEGCIDEILNR